tara:strand:- start:255 stop:1955 length:1701 start_codon:yes stop_codon:yes gene_type:complete
MSLPSVLVPQMSNENQSARIESVVLSPAGFSFANNGSGQATFRIPKKGILDSDSVLEYQVLWTAEDLAANSLLCCPQRLTGVLPIRAARLYIGGVLCDQLQQVASYLSLKKELMNQQKKVGVLDVKMGSDNSYVIDCKGRYRLSDEAAHNSAGSKSIQDDRAPEAQIKLSDLFGMLRDVALPLHALPEITIEIDWETNGNNVIASGGEPGAVLTTNNFAAGAGLYVPGELCDGVSAGTGQGFVGRATVGDIADGAGATAVATAIAGVNGGGGATVGDTITWTGRQSGAATATTDAATVLGTPVKSIDIPRAKCNMLLNFIHYDDADVMKLVNDSVRNGLDFQYRSRNLVQKTIPALGAGVSATTDIQLGFQNRFIQRILLQKLNIAISDSSAVPLEKNVKQVMLNQRSDKVNGEKLQLFINNQPLFDQTLESESFMYSILNQTFDEGMLSVPTGAYDEVFDGALETANTLALSNEFVLSGASGHGVNYQTAASGRQNWKSFPLMATNSNSVSPANAIRSGASPAVIRYSRTGVGAAEGIAAVSCNIWIETIKACNVRDGVINVVDA